MYIVPIAWLYVVVMMSVTEATNSNGTVLGAIITFVLYGVLPIALVMYLMGTPGRKRALRAKEAAERAAYMASRQSTDAADSAQAPDGSGLPATDLVTPVRKEP